MSFQTLHKLTSKIMLPMPVTLSEAEKNIVENTLYFAKGNCAAARQFLGISRPTLYRLIKAYSIDLVEIRRKTNKKRFNRRTPEELSCLPIGDQNNHEVDIKIRNT